MCVIPEDVKKRLQAFKMKRIKNLSAMICFFPPYIVKIDVDNAVLVIDEELDEVELDQITESLPEHLPRYIAVQIRHERDNGRVSYPLMLIFYGPDGGKTDHNMMYSNTINQLMHDGGFTKLFKVREVDEITQEWLMEQLSFFK